MTTKLDALSLKIINLKYQGLITAEMYDTYCLLLGSTKLLAIASDTIANEFPVEDSRYEVADRARTLLDDLK